MSLAEELAAEGDWDAARVERLRECARAPAPPPSPALDASILLGLGNRRGALDAWSALAHDESAPLPDRCRASLEAGYLLWSEGDAAGSWDAFRFAFSRATVPEVFWEAGCALRFISGGAGDAADDATLSQVRLCRSAWPVPVRARVRARLAPPGSSWWHRAGQWPGRGVVAFYRSFISPAIGARCSLHPSCSAYFLEATRSHGIAGIPIGADRLVREPDVVKAAALWVELPDGACRIADPLEAHDFWWRNPDP